MRETHKKKLTLNLAENLWNANIMVYHCCWLNNTGCCRNEKRRYLAFLPNCVGLKRGIPEGNSRDHPFLRVIRFPFVTQCCFTWYPVRGWSWNCWPFPRIFSACLP